MLAQCKQMYEENLHTKEQKFGNVKIFLFLEHKRMLTLEINKNEVERARLVKEAKFPVFLCTAEFNFTKPHLLKLCWVRTGPKQSSMDNPSQFQGMVYFNVCAVYWMRIETI